MIRFLVFCICLLNPMFLAFGETDLNEWFNLERGDLELGIQIAKNPKMRQGFMQYSELLGLSVSPKANVGFSSFNDSLLAQTNRQGRQCFNDLASKFYLSILSEDHLRLVSGRTDLSRESRASLASNLSDYSVDGLIYRPGWLWNRAMTFSKGKPILALSLIGLCGHDDVKQTGSKIKSNDQVDAKIWNDDDVRKVVALRGKVVNKFCENQDGCPTDQDLFSYWRKVLDYKSDFRCPSYGSVLFAPKSLGNEFDLQDELKQSIAKTQSRSADLTEIPLKSYHIYASAVSSCRLIAAGMPHDLANKVVERVVNAYRSGRVCGIVNQYVSKSAGMYLIRHPAQKIVNDLSWIQQNFSKCFAPLVDKKDSKICEVKDILNLSEANLQGKSADQLMDLVVSKQTEAVFSYLFSRSSFYDRAGQCRGLQKNFAVINFIKSLQRAESDDCSIPDVNRHLCGKARELAESYLIDFDWTLAQHQLGLSFAKNVCSGQTADFSAEGLNSLACD